MIIEVVQILVDAYGPGKYVFVHSNSDLIDAAVARNEMVIV